MIYFTLDYVIYYLTDHFHILSTMKRSYKLHSKELLILLRNSGPAHAQNADSAELQLLVREGGEVSNLLTLRGDITRFINQ